MIKEVPLQPKQKQLFQYMEDPSCSVLGYGGAKGGAKSYASRSLCVGRRYKYPGTRGLIFRRTYEQLNENHIMRMWEEYPYMRDWYNKVERMLTFPNGSTIRFGYAEYDDDILAFQGKEYDDIFIDQAEQVTEYQIAILKGSNRGTNPNIPRKFILTFNPGGVSHDFLKKKFVDNELSDEEKAEGWKFIQSHAWDNVEWCREVLRSEGRTVKQYYSWTDDQRKEYFLKLAPYARTLQSLPDENMVAAFLWGDFNVFSGQFLSMFRKDIHVIPDETPIEKTWTRNSTIDYGRRTVFLSGVQDNFDRVIIDTECYTEDMSPTERAEMIANTLILEKLYKIMIHCDTNMFADTRNYNGADKSIAEIFDDTFKKMMGNLAPVLVPISKKSEDQRRYRVLCNEAFKDYLNWKRGVDGEFTRRPRLFMKERCKHLVDTLPSLMYDEDNPLDINQKIGIDDPYDAAKYLLMLFYRPTTQSKGLDFKDDPTQYIIQKILIPQQKKLGVHKGITYTYF